MHTIQKKVIILETIQTDNLIGAFKINSLLDVRIIHSNNPVRQQWKLSW